MRATQIRPGLWQSDWPTDTAWMRRAGIRTVINPVTDAQARAWFGSVLPPYPPGVTIYRFPFQDMAGQLPPADWLDNVADAVATGWAQGPTLVHCAAGNNRSTIIVAAGLMRTEGIAALEALEVIARKRAVRPDPAMVAHLMAWQPR